MFTKSRRRQQACTGAGFIALFLSISLFSGEVFAHPSAEHNYLVDQCITRQLLPYEDARALCNRLQDQLDSALATAGDFSVSLPGKPCPAESREETLSQTSVCEPQSAAALGHNKTLPQAPPAFKPAARTEGVIASLPDRSGTDCIGSDCYNDVSNFRSQTPADKIEMQRRFETATIRGSDALSDLIFPGFGRFERKSADKDFRIDFLNSHRCHGLPKVAVCVSLTMR